MTGKHQNNHLVNKTCFSLLLSVYGEKEYDHRTERFKRFLNTVTEKGIPEG
jgi:hypothetical protein